jgi:sortase A
MPDDDHKHSGHFDASMPLPDEVRIKHTQPSDDKNDKTAGALKDSQNAAADLVRQKIDSIFDEPSAATEMQEATHLSPARQSRHQKFVDELINSGKSLPEIQEAWHEYYAGLPDKEKHEVWREFYAQHQAESGFAGESDKAAPTKPAVLSHSQRRKTISRAEQLRRKIPASRVTKLPSAAAPLRSLLFGLGVGSIVIIIFLFSFFNERFIAPFIQPSRTITNTPIINDSGTISPNPEIIIPKINVEIPVIYTVTTTDPDTVEDALEGGVVHYADTALPGQDGNGVIVGHSSNNIFNPGKYKFAFVLLSRLDGGDTFYLDKNGVRYTYQVYQKEIVSPTDVSVLGPQSQPATFSLITCDPPGTSTNRLVVVGKQISPSPSANVAASGDNSLATKAAIIPGNSPSLWSRLVDWFKS